MEDQGRDLQDQMSSPNKEGVAPTVHNKKDIAIKLPTI